MKIVKNIDSFLFLDIDGVMTPGTPFYLKSRERYEDHENAFAPEATKALEMLLERFPHLHIVLTSQIRVGKSIEDIKKFFELRGISPERVIGRTPPDRSIQFYPDEATEHFIELPRGVLIDAWMKAWAIKQGATTSEIHNAVSSMKYLIIDDSSDFLYHQRNHFLKCSNKIGFVTKLQYDKACHILLRQGVFCD